MESWEITRKNQANICPSMVWKILFCNSDDKPYFGLVGSRFYHDSNVGTMCEFHFFFLVRKRGERRMLWSIQVVNHNGIFFSFRKHLNDNLHQISTILLIDAQIWALNKPTHGTHHSYVNHSRVILLTIHASCMMSIYQNVFSDQECFSTWAIHVFKCYWWK